MTLAAVDYCEVEPPESLRTLIKVGWTLSVPDDAPAWITHVAAPDGCMEIIRRLAGRSAWKQEQPDQFVAGAITHPAELQLSPGSRFVALRIWPWTWRMVSGRCPRELLDRWEPLAEAIPGFSLPDALAAAFGALSEIQPTAEMRAIASALPSARTAGELSALTGQSPRALQRWFDRHVGQPPRSYLRMIRFGSALAALPGAREGLARHAADHGFADQAHMAREFRALAGGSANRAKGRAQGPFIGGK